ncbi:hypothetical protein [Massilia sp. LjRoot122]|uniref:hypothetical protein n=1 Tax=Massilia sp. LjRoot122 TaxID=3342257 RepID=UPI003ED14C59
MNTLVIKDLAAKQELAHEDLEQVQGGRAIAVLVDGRPGGVIDDFQLNMAIFKGDIGVKVV